MQALQFELFRVDGVATDPPRSETPRPEAPGAGTAAEVEFLHPQASRQIRLGHACVSYVLRRGRRRTIGFAIDDEGLRVSAPRWAPLAEIEAALQEKARWILDKLAASQERQRQLAAARIDWRDGAQLPYLGRPIVLQLDPRQRQGRTVALLDAGDAVPPTLWIGLPREATAQQLRDATQAWLMGQARRHFNARLDHFAPRLDVRWQRLALSSARTRWGSASSDGSIRLNWRLIHFSPALIDYVVVHELAHLHEMNHGARFWQHVQRVLPDYAERRGALRQALAPPW
jgi:predicted metal-dependent hydrolase